MKRLFDKTALITGAGRGLGEAMARRFSEEGAKVVVTDLDQSNAEGVAKEIDGVAMAMDVTDSARVAEVFAQVGERLRWARRPGQQCRYQRRRGR